MASEIVTFGEAMIRLSPPGYRRLEQANSLDLFIGGAELNTAVGLTRLGHKVSWVSRMTDNPVGRLLTNRAREVGVCTDHVLWTDQDRVGVYYLEFGAAPRASSVVYDRAGSAIANVKPGMIAWDKVFVGVKWYHVTGITPALGEGAAEATRESLKKAREMGVTTSIDLNYRAKLWSQQEAGKWMSEFMQYCDVLITTEEDTERVFGIKADTYEEVAQKIADKFSTPTIALTLRQNPFVWRNTWTAMLYDQGKILRTNTYEVEVVDRLGAGDSFAAGLIHGLLEKNPQKGLDYGVAASALKHSIPGDFDWVTLKEVESMLKGGGLRISR